VGGSNTYFLRDGKGNLIGQRLPDSSHWYYLKDGLGSIVAVINGTGSSIPNRYAYDPFGKVTVTGSQANPWEFAGGLQDSTKLVKFGTRYYDPNLGRWTQRGTIGGTIDEPSVVNRYTYVGCNPINVTDRSGKDCGSSVLWGSIHIFEGWEIAGTAVLIAAGVAGVGLFGAPETAGLSGAAAVFVFTFGIAPIAIVGGGLIGYGISDIWNNCFA
jgi:RHS repeat-associated protein